MKEGLDSIKMQPKIPLEMYNIPGELPLTERSLVRYARDKKLDNEIRSLALPKPEQEFPIIHIELPEDPEEATRVLEDALQDKDPRVQVKAVEVAKQIFLKDWELEYLLRNTLRTKNLVVWETVANAVKEVRTEKHNLPLRSMVSRRIGEYLDSDNMEAQKAAMRCVLSADSEDIPLLIKYGLESKYEEVQLEAAKKVQYAGFENVAALVDQALNLPNSEVQKEILRAMSVVPKSKVDAFIRRGLASTDFEVQKEAILAIEEGDKQFELIRECLENPDVRIQKKVMKMIVYIPGRQQDMIRNQLEKRINEALEGPDLKTISESVWLVEYLPKNKKQKILKELIDKGFGADLVKAELYNFEYPGDGKNSRQVFAKTGSETTLLGGSLKDKVIVRHITPEAFLVWQELYENYQMWKDSGFDYVPIEPIYSYGIGKNNKVDVYSGVLDLSFQKWMDMDGYFSEEVKEDMERIKQILENRNIRHGHAHENNFCLRFDRDSEGGPVFTKKPRIYLIDFDRAVSPGVIKSTTQ